MADNGLIGGIITAGTGIVTGIYGKIKEKQAQQRLSQLIANRPKYNIASEYGTNQSISGLGRDRALNDLNGQDNMLAKQNQNIDIQQANDTGSASQYANSTSGLLNAISGLNQNALGAKRDTSIDAAGRREGKMQMLQSADNSLQDSNNDMAEEKDKAWNFNVNEPYQSKVSMERDIIQLRQQQQLAAGGQIAAGGAQIGYSANNASSSPKGRRTANSNTGGNSMVGTGYKSSTSFSKNK